MAVVHDKLTTIGGFDNTGEGTNNLLCLPEGTKWEELLPPMSTKRVKAAAVTTPNHLVVAGGRSNWDVSCDLLCGVEVLDLDSHQWSSASSSPQALSFPNMTLCDGHVYLSQHNTVFSCSVEELLESRNPAPANSSTGDVSVWTKLADIPVRHRTNVTTLRGQVLAIGGDTKFGTPVGAIHSHDWSTDSWSVIGEMPTPRACPLVAILPSHELIVVGGLDGLASYCSTTEIASTH